MLTNYYKKLHCGCVFFKHVTLLSKIISHRWRVIPVCFKERVYNFLCKINPNVGVVSRRLSRARRCNLNMNLLMESVIELMQYNIAL